MGSDDRHSFDEEVLERGDASKMGGVKVKGLVATEIQREEADGGGLGEGWGRDCR